MRFTLRFSWMLLLPVAAAGGADRSPEPAVVASAPAAAASSLSDPDYRLTPRDEVIFEMFNEPDVKTTQRLTGKGELTLPLIGTVHLGGRTLREAEAFIRDRYKELGFFVEPQVMLSVPTGAIMAVTGILGALVEKARTGKGCQVDVSLAEACTWLLSGEDNNLTDTPVHIGVHPGRRLYRCGDGEFVSVAAAEPRTRAGPHCGWPHIAVGTTRAWLSVTGLPNISVSAAWMLALVTPPDVSKSFNGVSPGRMDSPPFRKNTVTATPRHWTGRV